MKVSLVSFLFLFVLLRVSVDAANAVVNLSHYDRMRPDFERMKQEGILGVIHEATFPRYQRDDSYAGRQSAAQRAGLLWGAYHFADATDPIQQADHFLRAVLAATPRVEPPAKPTPVLLVLDFEKNGHYPGGTMRVNQAIAFAERVKQRTGVYPGIYSNEYTIRSVLNNPRVSGAQKKALTNCWLWIANYHYEPRATSPWGRWHLWQYTGDGKCDLPRAAFPKSVANVRKAERNIFAGDLNQLRAFWIEHGWQPGVESSPPSRRSEPKG